ncbi:DNA-directed RNA polymerase subunit B, partial [archaeon]|nr:DNA-directed RNA polymerase subunit B [archaeon]
MESNVYVNGNLIGTFKKPEELIENIRELRRKGKISGQTNVSYDAGTHEIYVNTDAGRARRPLIVVSKGKVALKESHIEALKNNEMTWDDLVSMGIIEYIDSDEEENTYIAMKPDDLTKEHTHLEIDPIFMLGVCTAVLPFPEYNSAPRNTMGAGMAKQSLGLYSSNFKYRTDTRGHLLHYPHVSLVDSEIMRS